MGFNPQLLWWSRRMKPPSRAPGVGVTQSQRKAKALQKGHVTPRCHSTSASPKEDSSKSHPTAPPELWGGCQDGSLWHGHRSIPWDPLPG